MATKKKAASRRKIAAVWERGYQGHVYWLGKEKLGKVSLLAGSAADPRGKYRWDAAGKTGFCEQLDRARSAVELAVLTRDRQRDLFE